MIGAVKLICYYSCGYDCGYGNGSEALIISSSLPSFNRPCGFVKQAGMPWFSELRPLLHLKINYRWLAIICSEVRELEKIY
jgi:hypothetical protein